jgi:hypothetical protein
MSDFELSFSDKNITPWGGMSLMKRMLDRMGFDCALKDFATTNTSLKPRILTSTAHLPTHD